MNSFKKKLNQKMGSLCSISDTFISDENTSTVRGGSNMTSQVTNHPQILFPNMTKKGKRKYLTDFTPLDFCDEILKIYKIRIPFFDSAALQTISNISYLTGNGPYHEGLIFHSKNKNFYIAQSYPITFVKVRNFSQGISDIISFNNFNNTSRSYKIPEIYLPTMPITVIDIYEIINKLPNQYHIFTENCQNFVNNIIDSLKTKYRINVENNPQKIEEYLSEINLKKNFNVKNEENKENESEHLMQSYVDENSIYLINIFEEKKNKKLKNSRSQEDLGVFGRYKNINNMNNKNNRNNKNSRGNFLNKEKQMLNNTYSNTLKY